MNASIDRVFTYYQNVSGITIIRDPALTGTLTIASAKPVSLSEAFNILSASLTLRGFEIVVTDGMLTVRKKAANKGQGAGPQQVGMPGQLTLIGPAGAGGTQPPQETLVLRVYRIKYANASTLAQTLNDVLGQTSSSNGFPTMGGGPIGGPVGGGPGGGPGGPGGGPGISIGAPPPQASSQSTSTESGRAQGFITASPLQGTGGQGGRGGFGGPGGGGQGRGPGAGGFGGPQGMAQGQTQGSGYRASADDFSNSIIFWAPERIQAQVKDLIDQLDKPSTQPQTSKVYKLLFASADDLETIVQNLLNANAPKGRGGATSQQNQGPAAMIRAINGGVAGAGTVATDTRTNSLIVSATDENLKILDDVLPRLDTQVLVMASVFVFRLNYGQSDHIASLLQQALGQKQGAGSSSSTGQNNRNNGSTGRLCPVNWCTSFLYSLFGVG